MELDTSIGPVLASTQYVYITGTDPSGRQDQAVFRLKIGAPDDGSDNGDPHIHTVEGIRYDFQAVGEFILLRDREDGIEIQARQTPVLSANPIIDPYSGLRACVSVNTDWRLGRIASDCLPTRTGKGAASILYRWKTCPADKRGHRS